ncbi:MAG: hypothetical protein ACLR9P_00405 [Escherichia coli]
MNSIGMSPAGRERLRRRKLPMEDDALVLLLIENMRESGVIASITAGCICRAQGRFTAEQDAVWQKWRRCLAMNRGGADLARETHTDEQLMRQVLRHAAQQGMIVAIVKDRYYRNDRIVALRT